MATKGGLFTKSLALLAAAGLLSSASSRLIFEDHFDGNTLDSTKWVSQNGDGCDVGLCGWGNGELQTYTDDSKNLRVEDGRLKLQLRADRNNGQGYSSGKIRTYGLFDFTYGRVEARFKLPEGAQGVWPAFWMLPGPDTVDSRYGGWASNGEIDIMESSNNQECTGSAIHFGGEWPGNTFLHGSHCPTDKRSLRDDMHDYTMEWTPEEIRWYFDGELFSKQTDYYSNVRGQVYNHPAPFDESFSLIFNLALGGPGTAYTGFRQPDNQVIAALNPTFEVDWVRVYDMQHVDLVATGPLKQLPNTAPAPSAPAPSAPRVAAPPPPAPPAPVPVPNPPAPQTRPAPSPPAVIVAPPNNIHEPQNNIGVSSSTVCDGVAACGQGYPVQTCRQDEACRRGGHGCIGPTTLCRFCGFGPFADCPGESPAPAPPAPAPPAPSTPSTPSVPSTPRTFVTTTSRVASCDGVAGCGTGRPTQTCVVDASCSGGGLGCIGDNSNCRYCGFHGFNSCGVEDAAEGGGDSSSEDSKNEENECAILHGQCGGDGWRGSTCCAEGTECVKSTHWYSECRPTVPVSLKSGCSIALGQCGGSHWKGPTCCEEGSSCNYYSDYYSVCESLSPEYVPVCQGKGLQCAGHKYDGPHCCQEGLECVFEDDRHSLCK